jgi:magnesium chelatase family protein
VARYRAKISGPLLDRIDLQIEVPALPEADLTSQAAGEQSETVRARVEQARQRQLSRQGKANFLLTTLEIDEFCTTDVKGQALLKQAISKLDLSARAYHRILKVARTVADLAGAAEIGTGHIAEAVQYRRFDKN